MVKNDIKNTLTFHYKFQFSTIIKREGVRMHYEFFLSTSLSDNILWDDYKDNGSCNQTAKPLVRWFKFIHNKNICTNKSHMKFIKIRERKRVFLFSLTKFHKLVRRMNSLYKCSHLVRNEFYLFEEKKVYLNIYKWR